MDPETKTLTLAVTDLLEARMLRSLGFANRGGFERMWLGQAIHSRYQEQALERDGSYQREVAILVELEHEGWTVKITGRADGVRKEKDGSLVVEEIKSVRRGSQLPPPTKELYERQAQLYAWMLSEVRGEEVRPELVLIEIGSDAIERLEVEPPGKGLILSVQRRISQLIHQQIERQAARETRQQAAEHLTFPFPELRPGQEEILAAAGTALEHGDHLLLQAATGIGKTIATLYPALRYCLAHDKRLFVLTAKNLQQEMAGRVVEMLNQFAAFHSLRLRAKSRMCANDQLICHEDYCPYAKDYYAKLHNSGVIEELLSSYTTLEPDAVFFHSREAEVCPFEVSLELARETQVLICDYNYVFAPWVQLTEFAEPADLSDVVLVIDEIHNLVGRGRDYYSPQLAAETARRAALALRLGGEPLHFEMESLCLQLARLIESSVEEALEGWPADHEAIEGQLPESALWKLRPRFDRAFVEYLEHQRDTRSFSAEDPFVDLYFSFLKLLQGLVLGSGDAFSHCLERRTYARPGQPAGAALKILCKDPSRFLNKILSKVHCAIGLSATLSPPEFYRDLLGFEAGRTAAVEIPNPFPATHRRVVIDAQVATTYRQRSENYPVIARRLAAFSEAVPGNCLALFPSYRFLTEVVEQMPVHSKRILIQRRADGEQERQEILDTLRNALEGDVLVLAVAGGVFAEGVDYPGEMLKAVAVVGPCLPAVSLDQELLKRYYDERFDKGFEYAFVVPGMTRVVQAAGRLLRSPDDTGVIALFDKRFLRSPYRQHLPGDWLPERGPRGLVAEPSTAAEEFFRSASWITEESPPEALGEAHDPAASKGNEGGSGASSEGASEATGEG
ncbi:MAG: helicase C-terminal domain-containing protein [Acidobacteriota bacterium]